MSDVILANMTTAQKAEFKAAMDASGVVDTVARAAAVDAKANPTLTVAAISAAGGATAAALATERARIDAGVGGVASVADDLAKGPSGSFILRAPAAAQAAVAGAAPLAADFIARSTPKLRNLFDLDAVTIQSIIRSDGTLASAGGFKVTDYILVAGVGSISVNYTTYGFGSDGYALYDQNKVVIGGGGNSIVPGTPLAIPANVSYIRVSLDPSVVLSKFMVVGGATLPPEYRAFNAPETASFLNAALLAAATVRRKRANMFDPDAASVGKIPQIDQQQVVDIGAGISTTDYFPVRPGLSFKTYPASKDIGGGYGLFWFDKDQKYVGSVAAPFVDDQQFTPPVGAVFARFPYLTSQKGMLTILPVGITRDPNIKTHEPAYLTDASQWAGKNICQIGDSISATLPDGRWTPDAIKRLAANFALDGAAGGRKMIDALRQGVGNAPFVQSDFDNIDAVNIWLGTNDYGPAGATPLGAITDASTAATFFGYTKKAVEQLLTWKPTLLVTLTTPMYRNSTGPNDLGFTLADYQQAIRDVAMLYSLPLNDMARTSGINAFNAATLLYDGLHPNALGLRLVDARFVGFYSALAPNTTIS